MEKISSFGSTDKKSRNPVFGIDLGTTNSAISVIAAGNAPVTISLANGRATMPSCVLWKDGKFIVGKEAYEQRFRPNAVYSVKRFMNEPDKQIHLVDGKNNAVFTPVEISAEILKGLVTETNNTYGEVKDVVVTVPAYFKLPETNATRKACELAGLNVIDIIKEPTSASLCYPIDNSKGSNILVYDLGGGTFDATLVYVNRSESINDMFDDVYGDDVSDTGFYGSLENNVTVIGIRGDSHLGGDDLDNEMLNIVLDKLEAQGYSRKNIPYAYKEEMKLRLETFKKHGVNAIYTMRIDTGVGDNKVNTQIAITKEDFSNATKIIFNRTRALVDDLLKNHAEYPIERIVLVGGSTKNPILQALLSDAYPGVVIDNAFEPDKSVSQGAAIFGKVKKFGDVPVQVFDVLPSTVGILDTYTNTVKALIHNDSPLPATGTRIFTTQTDEQSVIELKLMQGDSIEPTECAMLGTLVIEGLAPKPAGEPEVIVNVTVNASSILELSATVDGIHQSIRLNLSGANQATHKLNKDEKAIARIRRAKPYLSTEDADTLEEMIVQCKNGEISIDVLRDFIKEHRQE